MKKRILFLILLASITVNAQKKVSFGIKGGVNYSTLISESKPSIKYDYTTGVYAGLVLDVHISDSYAIQPELVYTEQGAESEFFNESQRRKLNYLSIGLANKIFILNDGGLHLILGPSIDINNDYTPINLINNGWEDTGETFMDISLFGGLGYEFPFGIVLEARYKRGFIKTFESDFFLNEEQSFNSVFQFGIVYKFNSNNNKSDVN